MLDLDLKTRSGRTLPVRLFHRLAFGADGRPGASRTLVLNRARDDGTDPQRAAEIRFMRFFHHTPMAIATVDRDGGIVRTNSLFARLFQTVLERGGRSLDRRRCRRARPRGARCRDRAGGARQGRHRAGRCGARRRARRAFRALLRHRGRRGGARPGSRHRLCARDHRAARAGDQGHPAAEDGARRPARRRHRARLQQRALRHHDGGRFSAQRPQADRPVVPGHHADQAERQPGREPGAPAPGLLAQADVAPAGARRRRDPRAISTCCCAV